MALIQIHGSLGNAAMLYMLILGLWALGSALRNQGLSGSFWGALAIGAGLMLVQGLLGVVLWVMVGSPSRPIHILYGVLCAIGIPAAYAYLRTPGGRREALLYGLAALFIFGLAVRAISTAR